MNDTERLNFLIDYDNLRLCGKLNSAKPDCESLSAETNGEFVLWDVSDGLVQLSSGKSARACIDEAAETIKLRERYVHI